MQTKMALATVSGVRVLGFTFSSCDVQFSRRWISLAGAHFKLPNPRTLLDNVYCAEQQPSITMCRRTAFWNCRSGLPFTRHTVDRPQFRSPSEILDTCEAHLFESGIWPRYSHSSYLVMRKSELKPIILEAFLMGFPIGMALYNPTLL